MDREIDREIRKRKNVNYDKSDTQIRSCYTWRQARNHSDNPKHTMKIFEYAKYF